MNAVIRPATKADLPAITAIYADAVKAGTATFEIDPPDLAEMTRRFESLAEGGFPYLVATLDGAVVGYAYAGPYRARPAYRATVEDSIYIAPQRQGSGIGRRLLGALIDYAAEAGARQMVAVIGDRASAGSIALHRRLGFSDVGVLKAVGFKHGRWLDVVLMQRSLGPGDASPLG